VGRIDVLGVIPARGGSKGVPRKNIRTVAGKPLIAWTIEAALASRLMTRCVVSTEDAEIAEVAQRHGADVLRRPESLATDEASTVVVLQHAIDEIPAETVVSLNPTSPIRRAGLIDVCIQRFRELRAETLGTVHHDYSYEYGQVMGRRQEIQPRLVDNGNVYVLSADAVRAGRWIGRQIATVETTREEGIEIDEPFDLWLAEQVLLQRWPVS
jgi:CMP-N,N'-diacetyllegionaminic acid synthase